MRLKCHLALLLPLPRRNELSDHYGRRSACYFGNICTGRLIHEDCDCRNECGGGQNCFCRFIHLSSPYMLAAAASGLVSETNQPRPLAFLPGHPVCQTKHSDANPPKSCSKYTGYHPRASCSDASDAMAVCFYSLRQWLFLPMRRSIFRVVRFVLCLSSLTPCAGIAGIVPHSVSS